MYEVNEKLSLLVNQRDKEDINQIIELEFLEMYNIYEKINPDVLELILPDLTAFVKDICMKKYNQGSNISLLSTANMVLSMQKI